MHLQSQYWKIEAGGLRRKFKANLVRMQVQTRQRHIVRPCHKKKKKERREKLRAGCSFCQYPSEDSITKMTAKLTLEKWLQQYFFKDEA